MRRPGEGPVKLRDLARQVGVHPSTVSRVLSGDPTARLSESTRHRIVELARTTGYRPNRLGRSLKMQRTRILGMLIPDITNPFFSVLFRAVEDVAGAAGYNVILCNTDDSAARLDQHLRVLGEGHVDGLLVATAHRQDHAIDDLRARGTACVLVNRRRDDPDDSWVVSDDRGGARAAVAHLARLGHRRIAHIAGSLEISTTSERRAGFEEGMAGHGLPVDPRLVVAGGLVEEAGEKGMEELLRLPPAERPTAIFVANDFAALGAMAAARRAGMRVPEDVSIVGFNDSPLASYSQPPLTTLRVALVDMGRIAAELLIARLGGESGAAEIPAHISLPVQLVARGSTMALATGTDSRLLPDRAPADFVRANQTPTEKRSNRR